MDTIKCHLRLEIKVGPEKRKYNFKFSNKTIAVITHRDSTCYKV